MISVTTSLERSIGHRLLAYVGKCAHLHGHNYVFEVTVAGRPNEIGIVVDFKDLKTSLKDLLEPLDHAMVLHMNDPIAESLPTEKLVLLSVNPTAENLAALVFNSLIDLGIPTSKVVVRETSDGWAEVTAVNRSVRITAVH